MEGERKIFTIAFEGVHRAGKGTQIEILQNELQKVGIPCISIKGAGSRPASGEVVGDPKSDFWDKLNDSLHEKDAGISLWNEASYRLAREFLVWRDRVLSKEVEKELAPFGVLIVDRSLISNAALNAETSTSGEENILTADHIFPQNVQNRKRITPEMVLPDLIVELIAPKEILIERLDHLDSKFEFRKRNIEEKYEFYVGLKERLPDEIQKKIVSIDSSNSVDEVYKEVIAEIKNRFPEMDGINLTE